MIENNYKRIKNEIKESCSNRGSSDVVTLLAVSKTKSIEEIQVLYKLGVRDFGENQVQELIKKHELLPKDIRWHMIGHLQRNKVKYIAPFIYCIHSVDSIRIAEMIDKEAKKCSRVIPILVEINIANEESKFGIKYESTDDFISELSKLNNIEVKGLMTVAPNTEDNEKNRKFFKLMYELYIDISTKKRDNVDMSVLSMGMSKDYQIAIEEGATIVRVGSSLFGDRFYK